ncbi:hypothetical protein N658DRAFT_223308 [Parathielavia hyrcaniae]|uniref:Uncharacterized protein n=1 Tax=Parathielavia hyrcaniae TaxID=113614 RepID=A0AAN6PZY4_9PEZI|nr:hypothetical protein N658DRAFT_223308 [Parathielavia hyrcaniae]
MGDPLATVAALRRYGTRGSGTVERACVCLRDFFADTTAQSLSRGRGHCALFAAAVAAGSNRIACPVPGFSLPFCVGTRPAREGRPSIPSVLLMVSQSAKPHNGNLRPFALTTEEPGIISPCYAAAKDTAAEYTFRGSRLVARGTVVDSVDGLAGSTNTTAPVQCSAQVNLTKGASGGKPPASEILRSVCRSLVLNRKNRSTRFAMPADDFFGDFTWLCGRLVTGASESLVPEEFRKWFDCTKSLLIHGRSFEDILRESMGAAVNVCSSSSLAPNRNEYIMDTFFGRFFDRVVRMSLRLMVTRNGRVGMASERVRKGDLVVVLFGCSVPVLLRPSGDEGESAFALVGKCLLDGFMNGAGLGGNDYFERESCIE